MTTCDGCGASIPFEACPTCPSRVIPCPHCGEAVLVMPMAQSQMDAILKAREERLNE